MTSSLRTLRLLTGIGREIGPLVCVLYVAVSATAFVSPLLVALGLRPLVDGAADGRAGSVVAGAVVTGAALLLTVVSPIGYRWATIRMRERSQMVVQRRLLRLSSAAPRLEHFERPEFWDRLQVLKRGFEDLANGMALAFVTPVVVAQLVVTAVLLARLHPVLLLVPVVAVPAAWLSRRAERVKRAAELRAAADRRRAQQLFALAANPSSAAELRVHRLRGEIVDRHRAATRAVHRELEGGLVRAAAATAGAWLLFAAVYVGALVLVFHQVTAGAATAGDVALALGLSAAVVQAASRLNDLAGTALRVHTAAEHYAWLDAQAQAAPGERAAVPGRLAAGIDLEGVSFRYGGDGGDGDSSDGNGNGNGNGNGQTLSDVTLRLPAGAVVAVVGENGAGKTTLVKLVSGMYAPTRGRVLVDGTDLASLDLGAYRARLTAGFQDFVRFELPAVEAVGVADLPRIGDADAAREALGKAEAGFVDDLPDGLHTRLGSSWEGGVELSGGQWQKLAVARALRRPGPLLTVLDEPAASLDPQTEHALFEQIAREAREGRADGRVTVLVSHRFSTVRMADLIVVLDRGRVVEQGTHGELMGNGGLYAELYGLQAAAYR